jgi:hypothetical protein
MKNGLRRAGFVSLTVGALGCGDPARPQALRPQELFGRDTVTSDSQNSEGWRRFLDGKELHRAWVPAPESPWRPFYKPTLVAAIEVMESAAMPVRTAEIPPAEAEANLFGSTFDLAGAAIFVDLAGEQSVAWAAALRQKGLVPVLTINNWPHQFGILRLERPLGALLYYAQESLRTPLASDARPVFILERSRLGQKGLSPGADRFDNRFFHVPTDFPSALQLRNHRVGRIVYINPRGTTAGSEEDDLNEYFNELDRAGLELTYVKPGSGTYETGRVVPAVRETIFTRVAMTEYASAPDQSHYYHSYSSYSSWHSSYWTRSSGAWGGQGVVGGGGGFSS